MKKLIILTFTLLTSSLLAQKNVQNLGIDSLAGFDFLEATEHASHCKTEKERTFFMDWAKSRYVKKKFNLIPAKLNTGTTSASTSAAKSIGTGNNTINQGPQPASCTNIDFESNSTAGWTVAGDSQIMSGGNDPFGGFPCVYPGGNFSLRLNDNNITSKVNFAASASRVINVSAANNFLNFHFALDILNFPHSAAEAAKFKIEFFNSSNVLLACPYYECYYSTTTGPVGASNFQTTPGSPGLNIGNQAFPVTYLPWQTVALDLTAYMGQPITVKVTCDWCVYDYDWAYCYIDADCFSAFNATSSACGNLPFNLCGPTGMASYTWNAPPLGNVVSNTMCVSATSTGIYTLNCTPFTTCAASPLTYTFAIQPKPIAGFNFTNTACVNSVSAVSTSSTNGGPAITNYLWDWGDATTSAVNPANHTYTGSGPKTIKLVVTNAGGCKDSITHVVTISQPPVPNFTFNPACSGSAVNFTNSSTSSTGTNSFHWDFGDATAASTATNPTHNYASPGTYTVVLVATNTSGCIDSIKKTVNVFGRAVVNFTPTGVCFNTSSNFTNLTTTTLNPNTGAIATSSWSFGDGGSSVATNPAYTYTNPANATANFTYTAWLYVTTVNGCKDSLSKPITVYSLPSPNFVADSVCFNSPTSLTVTGNNNGNPNFLFVWDFNGDNIPDMSTANSPTTTTLPLVGNNNVTFTMVTSPNVGLLQCKNTFTKPVWVRATPAAVITNTNQCVNAPIGLSAVNSTIANGAITNYAWNYGNNTSSLTNATPSTSVNYATSGIYTVTLTVTGSGGCPGITTKTVSVFGRAVPNFVPADVCFNSVTNFTNTTSTSINPNTAAVANYSWTFGNGGSSAIQTPVYTYTNPANSVANTTYTAWLYVTTANGCKDSVSKPVTVYSLPTPNFTADSVCLGVATTLTDNSNTNGNPLFLNSWDFNSDNVADLSNNAASSTNIFTNPGNTSVTYTVFTSPNGGLLTCSAKITKNVWVHAIPAAIITHTNMCIDAQPNLMSGVNSTLAIGTITNYAWNYGNGNNNLINPLSASSFSYNLAGNYLVTLTVTSSGGCTNVATQSTDVWERPFANFTYSKACAGKQITLKGVQLPNSAPITNYDWDLNNTVPTVEASGGQVTYTYSTPGPQPINLLITSNQGCKNIVPGNIYINYNPKPNFYAPKRAGCADLCISVLDSSQAVPLPAKNSNWEWYFGNGLVNFSSQSNPQYVCYQNPSNLTTQDYSLKLIVRTDSGCVDSIIKQKYIRVYPNPKADFEWVGKDGDLLTPFISFQNTSIGYNRFYWYYNDGVNVTDSSNVNPSHYYNTDIPRDFQVFLAVKNQYGCKDTITKYVEIGPEYTFYIPNTFTPNQDGANEVFTGKGVGIKAFKMWIYDRWGEKLYYTEDINKGWDASVKGKYDKEKVDVYTYRCIVTDLWNKEHEYVGHVTLLK